MSEEKTPAAASEDSLIFRLTYENLLDLIRYGAIECRSDTIFFVIRPDQDSMNFNLRVSVQIDSRDQSRCRRLLDRLLDGGA